MRSLFALFLISFLMISCGDKKENNTQTVSQQPAMEMQMQAAGSTQVNIGDIVPNNLVCMVNNDYMGREQLEVEVDGKIYYGCCEMCQKRLPNDETVRVAVDPVSNNKVDKAEAVIAVTGVNGEVTYFENQENYKKYVETVLN